MEWKFKYYDVDNGVDWNSIEHDFDWFRDMVDVPQDPIWHAEGNVQIHTRMVIEYLTRLPEFQSLPNEQDKHILVIAALLHDVEKRSTTTEEIRDGRKCIIAPRHAQLGETFAREFLYKELEVPFEIREEICSLVRYHGAPLWIDDDLIHLKIINISQRCRIELLTMLAKADILGRICDDEKYQLEKIEFFKELAIENECFIAPKWFIGNLARHKTLNDIEYNPHTQHRPFDESKFHVHMVSGIAGSGKDYYIEKNLSNLPMISLDNLRREMNIKPTDVAGKGIVLQQAQENCKVQMRLRNDFVFNATNISAEMRSKWIRLFESYSGKVTIHYIEVPYKQLLEQNKNREFIVPTKIIDKMIHNLEILEYKEVFNIIYNIR